MKWKKIIIIMITSTVLLLGLLFFFVSLSYSDSYNKMVFENEIKKDKRFEKLLYCKHIPYFISDNVYEIVIKFKDGRIMGGEVRPGIYKFRKLTVIDNYRISLLYLDNDGDNSFFKEDGIYHNSSISSFILENALHKPSDYFDTDLNKYIDCYDEIKDFFEKIYYEGRIPGSEEDKGPDRSKWGYEEELKKYTGYIVINETDRVKIYVDYIGDKYDIERDVGLY